MGKTDAVNDGLPMAREGKELSSENLGQATVEQARPVKIWGNGQKIAEPLPRLGLAQQPTV